MDSETFINLLVVISFFVSCIALMIVLRDVDNGGK